MSEKIVGDYVVKVNFESDEKRKKKKINDEITQYKKQVKTQHDIAERMAVTHGSNMAKNYEKGKRKLPASSNIVGSIVGGEIAGKIAHPDESPKKQISKITSPLNRINKSSNERLKYWREASKKGGIFGVKGKDPFQGLDSILKKYRVAKYVAPIGGAFFMGKALLGLDPKNAQEKVKSVADKNRNRQMVAKSLGITPQQLKGLDIQAQNSGLEEGKIQDIYSNANIKFGSSGIKMVKSFVKKGIGKSAMLQKIYADILGMDLKTYQELASGMNEGIFTGVSTGIEDKTNYNKSSKLSRQAASGKTSANSFLDIQTIKNLSFENTKKFNEFIFSSIANQEKTLQQDIQSLEALKNSENLLKDIKVILNSSLIGTNQTSFSSFGFLGQSMITNANNNTQGSVSQNITDKGSTPLPTFTGH